MSEEKLAQFEKVMRSTDSDDQTAFIEAHHGELSNDQLSQLFYRAIRNDSGGVERALLLTHARLDEELRSNAFNNVARIVEADKLARLLTHPDWQALSDPLLDQLADFCDGGDDTALDHIREFEKAGVPREITMSFVGKLSNSDGTKVDDLVAAYATLAPYVSHASKVMIARTLLGAIGYDSAFDGEAVVAALRNVELDKGEVSKLIDLMVAPPKVDPDLCGIAEEAVDSGNNTEGGTSM